MSDEEKKVIEYFKRRIANKKTAYTSIYFKIEKLDTLINLIEKQSKEIEELKDTRSIFNMGRRSYKNEIEDKIKAKIEEYKKLINECPMNDEEIFCKECTEKCGFNQTIDVLQSLLEKE